MAFLGQTFDANELSLLPEGNYNATITQAELKPTNAGTGQYIKLRLDITGPTHQGRVVFGNLNIKNASAKAEEIGRQQLGEIMRAIGLAKVTDTDQLIGGQLSIKVAIKEGSNGYEARNEVKGYKAFSGSQPVMAAPAAPAQAAPVSGSTPPWMKK